MERHRVVSFRDDAEMRGLKSKDQYNSRTASHDYRAISFCDIKPSCACFERNIIVLEAVIEGKDMKWDAA